MKVLLVVLVATLVAAGAVMGAVLLGDGDRNPAGPAAGTESTLALAAWNAEAGSICRRADAWYEAAPRPSGAGEVEPYLEKVAEHNRRVNGEFAALPRPRGNEGDVQRLLRLFDEDEKLLDDMLDAVRRKDELAFNSVNGRLVAVWNQEDEVFRTLGTDECTIAFRSRETV